MKKDLFFATVPTTVILTMLLVSTVVYQRKHVSAERGLEKSVFEQDATRLQIVTENNASNPVSLLHTTNTPPVSQKTIPTQNPPTSTVSPVVSQKDSQAQVVLATTSVGIALDPAPTSTETLAPKKSRRSHAS